MLSARSRIEAQNARVTVISFGITNLAKRWIEETSSSFNFFIDPERKTYQAYGLESSLLRSWSPKIWIAYARLMIQGRKWRGIQGDSGQLGGDFIVDQAGILRMVHRSQDPTDRPQVEKIVRELERINKQQYYKSQLKVK